MTNLRAEDWKPIPGFDVLKWKEENQARRLWEKYPDMMRDTENMTDEEVREYFGKKTVRFVEERIRYAKKMKGGEKT